MARKYRTPRNYCLKSKKCLKAGCRQELCALYSTLSNDIGREAEAFFLPHGRERHRQSAERAYPMTRMYFHFPRRNRIRKKTARTIQSQNMASHTPSSPIFRPQAQAKT